MAEIGKDIEKAGCPLSSGSLVAIPTETVYGLAETPWTNKPFCPFLNQEEAKLRPVESWHLGDKAQA